MNIKHMTHINGTKRLRQNRLLWLAGLLLMLPLLVSCAPDASADILSPEMADRIAAREAAAEGIAAPEPTALPVLASLDEATIFAGLDDGFVQLVASADASAGEQIALANGCTGCHAVDPAQEMTGPTWYNMGNTAIVRVANESPGQYLHHSIVAPNDYIVSGYPANIMPANYEDQLSEQDLATLVAYLLSQQQEGGEADVVEGEGSPETDDADLAEEDAIDEIDGEGPLNESTGEEAIEATPAP